MCVQLSLRLCYVQYVLCFNVSLHYRDQFKYKTEDLKINNTSSYDILDFKVSRGRVNKAIDVGS